MNKLIKEMERSSNITTTANGAKSLASSLNSCVDFFGSISSMRARSEDQVVSAFTKAFAEDNLTALRILFNARDIRGGQGERKVFRTIARYLADNHTAILRKNLKLFSEYGRWDDYLCLEGTVLWNDVLDILANQLNEDQESKNPSLLAKWLPSTNTSSKETRRLARKICEGLGYDEKTYRKILSNLRSKIKIVEKDMCANLWGSINYERVPSRASMIYRKAFKKHDEERYEQYLEDVANGKKDIKSSTLYPYDIVRNIMKGRLGARSVRNGDFIFSEPDKTLNLQWDNLPNYVEPFNGLVIYDTSASMGSSGFYGGKNNQVTPISVALSLAIYIAERNTGVWKNCAIPFSSDARLSRFKGSNIYEKLLNLDMTPWYGSTNLQSAFDLILETALDNKVSVEDMPKTLIVVSDMQFDKACRSNKRSNFEQIKKKYKKSGYEMPNIIFWNVNAYGKDSPVEFDENGTALVSGASPAILKSVLSAEFLTPEKIMLDTVHSERYSAVTV